MFLYLAIICVRRERICFLATVQQQHSMADKTEERPRNSKRVFINNVDKYSSKNIARVKYFITL